MHENGWISCTSVRSKTQALYIREDSIYIKSTKPLKLTNVLFGTTNRSGKMIKKGNGKININSGLRDRAGGGWEESGEKHVIGNEQPVLTNIFYSLI